MSALPTVHLVDGTYELFRAHYSKRPSHRTPAGQQRKATVGLVSSLLALLHHEGEQVHHCAVAFDNPIRSFRNDLFADYKSDEGMDPELREQFDAAEEAVQALGLVVWSMDEFEADDALATGAHQFAAKARVRILTPDKDLGQCLEGDRVVAVDRRRERVITEQTVMEDWGVTPQSIPDLLALVGDASDGIPGLPGFGEKGAAALLKRYIRLERIPDQASRWEVAVRGADRLAQTLSANRKQAMLYRELATLRRDVPLQEGLKDLAWQGVPRARFEAWCDRLGTTSLKARPTRWAA